MLALLALGKFLMTKRVKLLEAAIMNFCSEVFIEN